MQVMLAQVWQGARGARDGMVRLKVVAEPQNPVMLVRDRLTATQTIRLYIYSNR